MEGELALFLTSLSKGAPQIVFSPNKFLNSILSFQQSQGLKHATPFKSQEIHMRLYVHQGFSKNHPGSTICEASSPLLLLV